MALNSPVQNPVTAGIDAAPDADSAAAAQTSTIAPAQTSPPGQRKTFAFRDMHLQVGDRLQLECPAPLGIGKVFVRVLGYLDNTSLIVTAPVFGGQRVNLVDNDVVVVRAFSRQSAFAFRASVLRTCRLPFDYLHLSFPEVVHGTVIRKSTRVRTCLATKCSTHDEPPLDAVIENISSTGVLLAAARSPGAHGEIVRLEFDARLHDVDTHMSVDAEVVSIHAEPDSPDGGTAVRCGLEFRDLPPSDRMVVKALVYQQIIENPTTIV
ncbi:flagellar brake protein [Aromatoleum petrolei]|uniref:Flagellar brake protein n=1 Tax=Aromatoleum petrolei TaxID=76116 RepID=A0ABX1MKU3_9RHOO|nr:flagellar brake protein [Aromatoleum petrolei]NMF87760.1 flagellar brake protein [Aromatoleum petrolei]QTQ38249.1 Putative flagellar brake protein [Aromatoleum petrolei]